MSFDSDMEAFQRAAGTPSQGEPMVSEEQKKELLIDDESAFQRAVEADSVDVDNSDVETEEDSLWKRFFSEPYERGIQRQAETFERMGNTAQAGSMGGIAAAMNDPAVLREQYRQSTNMPSVLLQTVTTPLRVAFDSASEMVSFGASKGVGFLPEGLREGAAEQFASLMETKGGQMAMAAAGEGIEAWKEFEQSYPNEAANLVAVMDLGFTKGTGTLVKQPVIPMKIERVGMRNETKPLAGGDADVYNILFEGKKKTQEQVELTTDPKGVMGKQEQIATPEQLADVDLAKTAGVNGKNTLQQNYNNLKKYYDGLEDNLWKLLGKNEKKTNWPEIDDNLRANAKAQFDALVQSNPKLMQSKEAQRQISGLYKEFLSILDEQGGTLRGLRVARSMFDDRLNRMGYDLSGDRLSVGNLAAMAVRKSVNQTIYGVVPQAEGILGKMSQLIPMLGSLGAKAATESKTRFGRFVAELGIEDFAGSSAQSKVINAGYVLGATVVLSPYMWIKNQLKRPGPAKVRAKIAYIKRDMFSEINKAIKSTKDPVRRSMLQRDSKEMYVYLNSVFKEVEAELEEEESKE
jgi:hypothetical protein